MKVKVKKLSEVAVVPKYAKSGDAGMDLTATSCTLEKKPSGERIVTYGTDLAFEIPQGYVGLIYPRSSVYKTSLILCNHVGVVDSGYRGEVKFKFRIDASARPYKDGIYKVGERIGQIVIVPYPKIEFEQVNELSETSRGSGGYGSTGK